MYDEDLYYTTDDELMHYGVKRRSGRYPWGSGKDPYQRTEDFLARVNELKKSGMTETQIANAIGLTTTQLRVQVSLANSERRAVLVETAVSLRDKGYSLSEITRQMGFKNDSSVRSLLNEQSSQKMNEAQNVAAAIKKAIDEKGMIDVGAGVERELGCSKEKLQQALYILEREGYPTYGGRLEQVTNKGKFTTLQVICPPGTEHKDIYDSSKINSIRDYNTGTGEFNVRKMEYPASLDINRLAVRYAEDGGVTKDGTIEIRRGCKDLDLGGSHYAQVRILVDGDRYLKGMAVYKDDDNFPPGVDVVFNTNKGKNKSVREVLKEIKKDDPTNPFGATIKENGQYYYDDPNGKYIDKTTGKRQSLGLINKKSDEGDWENWADTLPSQFLSKQNMSLIKKQLSLTKADKIAEYDEIMSVTNPTVRKHLLQKFAEDCDGAAVHLKAAALPRQKYQVILPIDSLKDDEVYAPNYKDGEKICLVRYPHGGTFEIPTLTVNNKNKDAIKMIGKNPIDAVCINSNVAERLSGADFDGDFVMCLPTGNGINIKTSKPLKGLEGFDNKKEYPATPNSKRMKKGSVGREMGVISNLITDMTLKGASDEELTRAVKHSMVVIDAYKHELDYKKSERDNNIAALKKRYQSIEDEHGNVIKTGGASTLISRAKSKTMVEKRVGSPKINTKDKPWYDPNEPEGALLYNRVLNKPGTADYDPSKPANQYVQRAPQTHKSGKPILEKSTAMFEAKDARSLSSGRPQEELYADYANSMKALANQARKSYATTPRLEYSAEAKKTYAAEHTSLNAKLANSEKNAPKERQAQAIASSRVKAQIQANPQLENDNDALRKLKNNALNQARAQVGAKREPIVITDKEWEAIQKGAISENTLSSILKYADMDSVRSKATPRQTSTLSPAKINKIQCMRASGYTNQEIAEAIGVSISTVVKNAK